FLGFLFCLVKGFVQGRTQPSPSHFPASAAASTTNRGNKTRFRWGTQDVWTMGQDTGGYCLGHGRPADRVQLGCRAEESERSEIACRPPRALALIGGPCEAKPARSDEVPAQLPGTLPGGRG